jgi:NADPH:quinone reductase-like Zn-dependent oxidoreductase
MRGYTLFEVTDNPRRLEQGQAFVEEGLRTGALHPIIARTFPLDQIADAHRFMEGGTQIGKIVVTV